MKRSGSGKERWSRGWKPRSWLTTVHLTRYAVYGGRGTFPGPPRNRISTCTLVDLRTPGSLFLATSIPRLDGRREMLHRRILVSTGRHPPENPP